VQYTIKRVFIKKKINQEVAEALFFTKIVPIALNYLKNQPGPVNASVKDYKAGYKP
jgi:hypothetical protein